MIGIDVHTVYTDPKERDQFLSDLKKYGAVSNYPQRLRLRDGTVRYVLTNSHFYRDANGTVQGIEGIIHDITSLKVTEDALRMANRKLSLLSGITRHDIRNQLMALEAYLYLSEETLDNPAQLAEYVAKETKIADTIAHQLDFARDYEEMGALAPEWQNVNAAIRRAVATLPTGSLRVDLDSRELEVRADPLFEKVFYNLLDNTLRYGGETMTGVKVSLREEGDELVIVFADDGVGVGPADKPHLFEKGFGRNTGLGLFLSREILSITEMTITETGIFGKGSQFEIRVPAGSFRFVQ
jgi:signal transduction histidine kinase